MAFNLCSFSFLPLDFLIISGKKSFSFIVKQLQAVSHLYLIFFIIYSLVNNRMNLFKSFCFPVQSIHRRFPDTAGDLDGCESLFLRPGALR